MTCHYCGYERPVPMVCPDCGSKHITAFGTGTQKVEAALYKEFPEARIMRMDFDTTRKKESYNQMLEAFSKGEADILVGTQMIVKGHDFSKVTLMGILAADMSLHVSDFHAAERTFQLLTQAAGRAGRGSEPGDVIIQTYDPEHYAVLTAQAQNYEDFYQQEITYRMLMSYPPIQNLLVVMCTGEQEQALEFATKKLYAHLEKTLQTNVALQEKRIQLIGPANATISKVNDIYRKVIYMKTKEYQNLVLLKERMEWYIRDNKDFQNVSVQFDFNPMSGF
jgi:primosomal protein N' (replication factor Y)